ncbi:MAG: LVIVD repeat-containing protein [Promethearchaeota archaeon]
MSKKQKIIVLVVTVSLLTSVATIIPLIVNLFPIISHTRELGQIDTGRMTIDVEVHGDIAYVVDATENNPGGLLIINVSDPANPIILASYYQSGLPWKVSIVGEIAYLANSMIGLEVLSISDPTNPVKIDQYTGSGVAYDVEVVGDVAYLADWSRGLVILNVSNPSNVREIRTFLIPGACIHVSVANSLAYIVDHHTDYSGLRVVNVSDPSHPLQLDNHAPSGVDYWNPFVYGDYVYIGNHGLGGGELRILNAHDPSNIVQVGVFDQQSFISSSYVNGNRAYLADYMNGLVVVDVTIPISPVKRAQYFDGGHAFDVDVISNIAYVADGVDGLEIIEIMN